MAKRKTTVSYTAFVTPDEDKSIRQYGDQLKNQGRIKSNTKYAIVRFLLDQVLETMKQSFLVEAPAAPQTSPGEAEEKPEAKAEGPAASIES